MPARKNDHTYHRGETKPSLKGSRKRRTERMEGMSTKRLGCILTVLVTASVGLAAESVHRSGHTAVIYDGIEPAYAEAIAQVAEVARESAIKRFRFEMPGTVEVRVTLDPQRPTRLFTDGHGGIVLEINSPANLRKPSESGVYNLYGICHEIGHLAMHRAIPNRPWMTSTASEGWAHYLGSEIVDDLYATEKEDLWPDSYNYLADGTARLESQLADGNPPDIARAAGLWKEFVEIVGDARVALAFEAWSEADVDLTDPGVALQQALRGVETDPRLARWWNKAEPVFVSKRSKSGFTARTAKPEDLLGRPLERAHDDGVQVGKGSFAGNGHAVRFAAPGNGWYLTEVRIYGSRYGSWRTPKDDFHIWLCDKDLKIIADFAKPYGHFKRGRPRWVSLPIEPTKVPSEFVICVAFNPTLTQGVYLGYDASDSGHSLIATAGKPGEAFGAGDWMIRVKLDQLKTAPDSR